MKTNTRLYSVLNCTVHVSVCRRFVCQRFWSVDVLVCRRFGLVWFVDVLDCRRFGLSTFRSVDALVCWCFGMSMFWFVDALVCRHFGLSTFRYVSVSVCRRFGCRRFGLSTFWPVTYKRVHFDTPNPVYKYGHHFCRRHIRMDFFYDIFHNLALLEFYFLNIIYILLYIDYIDIGVRVWGELNGLELYHIYL